MMTVRVTGLFPLFFMPHVHFVIVLAIARHIRSRLSLLQEIQTHERFKIMDLVLELR